MPLIYETPRLLLFAPDASCGKALAEYYQRNRDFLAPWDPDRPPDFFSVAYQKRWARFEQREMKRLQGLCLLISKLTQPDKIIGMVRVSNILYGNFCSAFVGYRLDKDELNHGYMTEALCEVKRIAFEEMGLHRLEASTLPENHASQRVLEKAGFRHIGHSDSYLKINGQWQAHELFELCAE